MPVMQRADNLEGIIERRESLALESAPNQFDDGVWKLGEIGERPRFHFVLLSVTLSQKDGRR